MVKLTCLGSGGWQVRLNSDGRAICPACGHAYAPRNDGKLRVHRDPAYLR